ncbi:hypothetical protein FAES_3985 [Fibrella aestuarina BUZ 2]|uniref:Uncharacterized protein n=1 Tax=Fibrella aestuarina BUZ 2 TaxID=1166018 RepID=I0KCY3_9BACT|nr:hypothetical protein [Fibrella aestuarina]CCH01986.1 hypothetical protein FAES_3985 [Fibrella aestuarina BUZ 2]
MNLIALERQTGSYGVANEGDTVTVSDEYGAELLKGGCFKLAPSKLTNPTATPEQEIVRNESGMGDQPVHKDATEAEIRNSTGPDGAIEPVAPTPSEVAEAKTEHQLDGEQENVEATDDNADMDTKEAKVEQAKQKTETAGAKRQTKEDKAAVQTK